MAVVALLGYPTIPRRTFYVFVLIEARVLCVGPVSAGRNSTTGYQYQFLLLNFITKVVLLIVVTFDD